MGEAGGGEGVGGSPDLVARMEPTGRANARPMTGSAQSGIRSAATGVLPRVALRSTRATGYEPPRMAARIKFPLAECPERR